MSDLEDRVKKILDQFAQEELGNRLSQFAMLSLKSLIMAEIKKEEPDEPTDRKIS